MIPFKKEKGIVAATAGILSSAMLAPTASGHEQVSFTPEPRIAASSHTCYSQELPSHCYAVAKTNGFIADGAAARFDVRPYTAPDWLAGGFTEQTLWIGVESTLPDAQAEWCEIGWTKAYIDPDTKQPNGNYSHYFAFLVNANYEEYFPTFPLGDFGTSHHYQVARQYDGLYNFYIDFQDVGDCHANPFTLWAHVGLEATDPDAQAAVNDPRELQWRRATDLAWFNWGALDTDVWSVTTGSASRWRWEQFPTHGEDWTTN